MTPASAQSPLRFLLDIPLEYHARVRWILSHAARVWGVAITDVASSESADIVYSASPPSNGSVCRFDPTYYAPGGSFALRQDSQPGLWASGSGSPDVIGGIYRLLMLLDEHAVAQGDRNALGIFNTPALPAARRAILDRPMVEHHLEHLWLLAAQARPDLVRTARWPDGKRWACVITHDTDAVSLGRPRELIYNAAKLIVRREPVRARMIGAGLRHRRQPMRDPYFGFPGWHRLEMSRDVRSAFYLFVLPNGVRRHVHDSRSAVIDPGIDVGALREMADAGWEFGLHASIHARRHIEGFRRSKALLEDHLDRPVAGLRHHYWALDWERPWQTFRQHADAGFRYDSSLAWRDIPGFRAGTSLPFQPFDPELDRPIQLWELPAAMMDGHLLDRPSEPTAADAQSLIKRTREAGGALVLNWHTETANQAYNRAGFRDAFEQILEEVMRTGDAWITTPTRLLDHWEARGALDH